MTHLVRVWSEDVEQVLCWFLQLWLCSSELLLRVSVSLLCCYWTHSWPSAVNTDENTKFRPAAASGETRNSAPRSFCVSLRQFVCDLQQRNNNIWHRTPHDPRAVRLSLCLWAAPPAGPDESLRSEAMRCFLFPWCVCVILVSNIFISVTHSQRNSRSAVLSSDCRHWWGFCAD